MVAAASPIDSRCKRNLSTTVWFKPSAAQNRSGEEWSIVDVEFRRDLGKLSLFRRMTWNGLDQAGGDDPRTVLLLVLLSHTSGLPAADLCHLCTEPEPRSRLLSDRKAHRRFGNKVDRRLPSLPVWSRYRSNLARFGASSSYRHVRCLNMYGWGL